VQKTTLPEIKNEYVKQWLNYTNGSESPEIFNLWTGLSTIAACLGRRSTLNTGRFIYYPNMYVVISGPAAVRKSSAAAVASSLLKKYTNVKFGPMDTAGKRQGLLNAFLLAYGTKPKAIKAELNDALGKILDDATISGDTSPSIIGDGEIASMFAALRSDRSEDAVTAKINKINQSRRPQDIDHDLLVFADELSDFIGMKQDEMISCLTTLHGCPDSYDYSLAGGSKIVHRPGLNLLGCTTTSSLVKFMPEASIGGGFSSRTIFVYAGQSRAKVFRPAPLDKDLTDALGKHLRYINGWSNEFTCTKEAEYLQGKIYEHYVVDIKDTRFSNYIGRRDLHLSKVMMNLAAGRGSSLITADDVLDAHIILMETEKDMHLSLGELGLDKTTIAKQQIRETIEQSSSGVRVATLRSNALRDMTSAQFHMCLSDLVQKGVCVLTTMQESGDKIEFVVPKIQIKNLFEESPSKRRSMIENSLLSK
jgi:hypothetical protein